jgi:hypothetical protein
MRLEKAKRTVLVRSKYALAEAEYHTVKTTNPSLPAKKLIWSWGGDYRGDRKAVPLLARTTCTTRWLKAIKYSANFSHIFSFSKGLSCLIVKANSNPWYSVKLWSVS